MDIDESTERTYNKDMTDEDMFDDEDGETMQVVTPEHSQNDDDDIASSIVHFQMVAIELDCSLIPVPRDFVIQNFEKLYKDGLHIHMNEFSCTDQERYKMNFDKIHIPDDGNRFPTYIFTKMYDFLVKPLTIKHIVVT